MALTIERARAFQSAVRSVRVGVFRLNVDALAAILGAVGTVCAATAAWKAVKATRKAPVDAAHIAASLQEDW